MTGPGEIQMDFEENEIPISWEVDIAVARLAGGEMARQAGFGTIQTHCVMTSISELSANIFFHAGEGNQSEDHHPG